MKKGEERKNGLMTLGFFLMFVFVVVVSSESVSAAITCNSELPCAPRNMEGTGIPCDTPNGEWFFYCNNCLPGYLGPVGPFSEKYCYVCDSDADCADGKSCSNPGAINSACVACDYCQATDELCYYDDAYDCDTSLQCNEWVVKDTCSASESCEIDGSSCGATGTCYGTEALCAECSVNSDCPDGKKCSSGSCVACDYCQATDELCYYDDAYDCDTSLQCNEWVFKDECSATEVCEIDGTECGVDGTCYGASALCVGLPLPNLVFSRTKNGASQLYIDDDSYYGRVSYYDVDILDGCVEITGSGLCMGNANYIPAGSWDDMTTNLDWYKSGNTLYQDPPAPSKFDVGAPPALAYSYSLTTYFRDSTNYNIVTSRNFVLIECFNDAGCSAGNVCNNPYTTSSFCGSSPPACGDGNVDAGEQCDDGNTNNGDGCSSTCQIEVAAACGDGNVDVPGETCDGSNLDGFVCTDFGTYTGGPLDCYGDGAANECTFDFSGCIEELGARYYWTNMNGNEISEAQVGDTVRLVAEEVASGTFSIKEDDLVLDDDIRDVVGSGVGVDLVGVWTIGEDDLELASNNDGPLGEVGDYEFYFNLGGSMDSDILYVSPDEDDSPMTISIEGVPCGSYFDEDSVSEITIIANDIDDEIVGSVTIYGVITTFSNGGVVFNQTFDTPGSIQILVEASTADGDAEKRIISNVMVLDKSSGSYVDDIYAAACIDEPEDLSNIPGGLVKFNASSTRGVKVTGGVVDELVPGIDAFSWYWTFYPEGMNRSFVNSTESSAYIFEAVLPMAGTNTAELVVEVN